MILFVYEIIEEKVAGKIGESIMDTVQSFVYNFSYLNFYTVVLTSGFLLRVCHFLSFEESKPMEKMPRIHQLLVNGRDNCLQKFVLLKYKRFQACCRPWSTFITRTAPIWTVNKNFRKTFWGPVCGNYSKTAALLTFIEDLPANHLQGHFFEIALLVMPFSFNNRFAHFF